MKYSRAKDYFEEKFLLGGSDFGQVFDAVLKSEPIQTVYLGCVHREHQYEVEFSSWGVFPESVSLFSFKDEIPDGVEFYACVNNGDNSEEPLFFDSRAEADAYMEEIEDSLEPTIEKLMETFASEVSDVDGEVRVDVIPESLENEYFYSFNIYLDGVLIQEGMLDLDAESFKLELEAVADFTTYLKLNCQFSLKNWERKAFGFNSYYYFTFEQSGFEVSASFQMRGGQGLSRDLSKWVEMLDLDAVRDEFAELKE